MATAPTRHPASTPHPPYHSQRSERGWEHPPPRRPGARGRRPRPGRLVRARNRDHPVRLRLMDGSELDGVLVAADTYTLALRLPGPRSPSW